MTTTLNDLTKNLFYISETDAEIIPFTFRQAACVTAAEVLFQSGHDANDPVETIAPDTFFSRLMATKDWFGPREKERAARFAALKTELEKELKDIKVFRVGKVQIEIFVVGLDGEGRLAGVKTKAVET